jgi:hypothetical protein
MGVLLRQDVDADLWVDVLLPVDEVCKEISENNQ